MKRILCIYFSLVCLGSVYAQEPSDIRGHFKVRKDAYIQLGYDVPKTLTFGVNTAGVNKGRFGLETYTHDAVTSGFKIYNTRTNTNNPFIFIKDDGCVGIGTYHSMLGMSDKDIKMNNHKLIVNGSLRSWELDETSDERLKINIKSIEKNNINDIEVYEYTFRNNIKDLNLDDKEHFGVKAQELKEVYSNLVYDAADYMSVNYNELIPLLIHKLKEQNAQIIALETILSQY